MTTTTTVRFDVKVKRRDINRLEMEKTKIEADSDTKIEFIIVEFRRTANVHVTINGDEHRTAAFTAWVQKLALQPPY